MTQFLDPRLWYGLVGALVYFAMTDEEGLLASLDGWRMFVARLGIGTLIVSVAGWLVWRKEE